MNDDLYTFNNYRLGAGIQFMASPKRNQELYLLGHKYDTNDFALIL